MSQSDVLRGRISRASAMSDAELEELGALVSAYLELHPDDLSLAMEAESLYLEISGRRYLPRSVRERPLESPPGVV